MRNDHQYKIVMVRRRWQRFTAAHADERLLYEVAETTTYYCTSRMAHRRGERRLRRNTVYGRHVTAPARRRRRRRRCTYTHSIYSIVRDGDVWEGRTCVHALMETTCVYGVSNQPLRSPWSHECNCIIYPSVRYIYSIFCTMRYIRHTILFYDTPYYILFWGLLHTTWAYSILFCTLHLLWSTCILILHTPYSILQNFILHLNNKYIF